MLQVVNATSSRLQTGGLCPALSSGFSEQWSWGPGQPFPSHYRSATQHMLRIDWYPPTQPVLWVEALALVGTVEWAGGGQA